MGETDLISRRAAIDMIRLYREDEAVDLDELESSIALMPSAHPEIVRCKDCKNSEHWYRDRRRCFLWSEEGVSVFNDGFCNYAERRADE